MSQPISTVRQTYGNSRGKILVTDDDARFRRALSKTLCILGFDVVEAEDGEYALSQIGRDRFDVVLLDMNMPGMGGLAACREMRSLFLMLQILILSVPLVVLRSN
jgi:two-component system KDP operon response regulator KdpE